MLHYPPRGLSSASTFAPTTNSSLFAVYSKLGIEAPDTGSTTHLLGALVFDLVPLKKTKARTYKYDSDHVPYHYRMYMKEMWMACTSKVGVIMGALPTKAFRHIFSDRVRTVAKVWSDDGSSIESGIMFFYHTPDDMQAERIGRIVFYGLHPERFLRSRSMNCVDVCSLLAAERFLDAATLLATGQVPRPSFLSYGGGYFQRRNCAIVVPIAKFEDINLLELKKVYAIMTAARKDTTLNSRTWSSG